MQIGSANIETMKEAGYSHGHVGTVRGTAIFRNERGERELFARRSPPISGWQIKWRGAYYEFCSSVPEVVAVYA